MLAAPALVLPASSVFAVQYMTAEEARAAMFPAAADFAAVDTALTPDRDALLRDRSGVREPWRGRAWRVVGGTRPLGTFFVDRVIGKHELITYAVALDPAGRVDAVEILEYREMYGGQVRNAAWRNQFAGKGAADSLRLGQDIRNITGATLSCRHVTDGIRRLAVYHDLFLRKDVPGPNEPFDR